MSILRSQAENSYLFENGYLIVRKPSSEVRIRGWDEPSAVKRIGISNIWESFSPDFQLVRPRRKNLMKVETFSSQLTFDFFTDPVVHHTPPKESKKVPNVRRDALEEFAKSLPEKVAEALEPFRVGQWNMLVMMFHDPGTIDLALANPTLAFLLSQKLNGDIDQIRSLKCGQMRRRDIMTVLGYPATNAAVNIVNKILPSAITTENWESIVEMLGSEISKEKTALGHVSKINVGVLEVVVDPVVSLAIGPKALEGVAIDHREKTRARVVHMVRSALEMQEDFLAGRKITFFHDLPRLYEVHERVTNQYKRRVRQLNDAELAAISGSFDVPPIAGIPGRIEPLTCPRDLVDEGEIQGNCVASYARKMLSGNLFVYRVIGSDRCTLSIVKKRHGWEIGELEAKFNSPASKETERFVRDWLKASQAGNAIA